MVSSHYLLSGCLVYYLIGDIMKNYHALGILIAATIIFVSACSMAHAAMGINGAIASTIMGASETKPVQPVQRPTICPTPTQQNSGFVLTDEDGDGKSDTIWQVYVSGVCSGYTVGKDDHGTQYKTN